MLQARYRAASKMGLSADSQGPVCVVRAPCPLGGKAGELAFEKYFATIHSYCLIQPKEGCQGEVPECVRLG